MINAILLIFFGMSLAEQTVITELACNVPEVKPVSTHPTNADGWFTIYSDGSYTIESLDGDVTVRSKEGYILYK